MNLLHIAARLAAIPPDVQKIVDYLYNTNYEWAWKAAGQIETIGMTKDVAVQHLYDLPYEKAWVIAELFD